MQWKGLQTVPGSIERTEVMLGYMPEEGAPENGFYDMENLCSNGYPYLTPRKGRVQFAECEKGQGICGGDALLWADGGMLYYNGVSIGAVQDSPKQFISMGGRTLILPDKLVLEHEDLSLHSVEAAFTTMGNADITLCTWAGEELLPDSVGDTAPEEPEDGALWLDTSAEPVVLQQYSAALLSWTPRMDTAVCIAAAGIGTLFGPEDGVTLSGCEVEGLNGSHILLDAGQDHVRFSGILQQAHSQSTPLKLERSMPELDFAVEHNNRIWGCSTADHCIYACKLGDPYNWNSFAGTAADSYAVSVGTPGPFTGAAEYGGAVLFFKEDVVHKLIGSKPANFQLDAIPVMGVKAGAHGSIAGAAGLLFYQAVDGVRIYNGLGSSCITGSWGADQAGTGGALGDHYYICLPERGLLCYDAAKGLWHRQDSTQGVGFAACRGGLYLQTEQEILCIDGAQPQGTAEGAVCWMAETGEMAVSMPDGSYVRDMALRVQLEQDSSLCVEVCYDESRDYKQVYAITAAGKRSYRLPILPRYAGSMRLRLRGSGAMRVYGWTKCVSEG